MRVVAGLLALLFARSVFAFSGPEHRDLSNMALLLAEAHVDGRMSPSMRAAVDWMAVDDGSFGELNAAVDLFSNPPRLAGDPWPAVKRRRSQFVQHLLALHRNGSHFQREAIETYVRLHRLAVSLAEDDALQALRTEAVAQHYLQSEAAATPARLLHAA